MFKVFRDLMLKPIRSIFWWRHKDNEDYQYDLDDSNDSSLQEKLINNGTIKIVLFK